ncbi:MAG: SpoIIE family protein phosphatase [Thermoanaerobaculia bacterium]|nr:SpoIIE family protein phosphatase [Thermoanaerobaculia bacterium]
MRFRFRLALVFLLLSAVPLTVLALYSFTTSSRALRQAAEAEAKLMARDLEQRVEGVSTEIDRSVKALARLPAAYWLRSENGTSDGKLDAQVFAGLAQALPFIEDFRFVPRGAAAGAARGAAEPRKTQVAVRPLSPQEVRQLDEERLRQAEEARRRGDEQLRLAEKSVTASLLHLPAGLPEADRKRIQEELEQVRAEIGRSFASRRENPGVPPAPPLPPTAPVPAPAPVAEVAGAAQVAPVAPVAAPAPVASPNAAPMPLADGVSCPVTDDGQVVGEIQGRLKAKEILRSVLGQTHREQGEVPFAIDSENKLYVATGADGEILRKLPSVGALRGEASVAAAEKGTADDWVVVARRDPVSGLRFGIARPISQAMKELRRATAWNFVAGFFLVGIATIGMIPLTSGMVKSVQQLEAGAARIAGGDLQTRVPVRSRDEFGRLAGSFNHMAEQLAEHQARLIEQERLGKEREIERRLLEAENGRKSQELEEARLFQLSLLPRQLPQYQGIELAVAMSTATEVGGDYYDFRTGANGDLLLAIGDATGHGAAAGTMVTVVKSLFLAAGDDASPAGFLRRATGMVHGMGLSRMAMALAVARLAGRALTISSAGMPPALHFRAATGEVDEIALAGMPLGARNDFPYSERRLEIAPGDVVLLMSDGFPELPNPTGEPLGYERARAHFAVAASRGTSGEGAGAGGIVAALEQAAANWSGADAGPDAAPAPSDDVTFLVLRAT